MRVCCQQQIAQWAAYTACTAFQHMCVDLSGLHITVAQLLLHSTDVDPCFKQVSGKGVPQGVAGNFLGNSGLACSAADQLVQSGLIIMVAPQIAGARLDAQGDGGKQIVPAQAKRCARTLAGERGWKPGAAVLGIHYILLKLRRHLGDLFAQVRKEFRSYRGDAVFVALAGPDAQLSLVEVNIMNAQTNGFDTSQP
jgi:hypothetical protein